MAEFERIVWVSPAFDKRHSDPKKDCGVGACRITFILKGPKGAVQFMVGTDWYPPDVQRARRDWWRNHNTKFDNISPTGWDVGYHSPAPRYEGQTSMKCELMESGECYYDGSGLRADDWVPQFIAGGTPWLWPELEREYHELFSEQEPA